MSPSGTAPPGGHGPAWESWSTWVTGFRPDVCTPIKAEQGGLVWIVPAGSGRRARPSFVQPPRVAGQADGGPEGGRRWRRRGRRALGWPVCTGRRAPGRAVHCLRAQPPGRGGPCGVAKAPDVEPAERRRPVGAPVDRGGWRAAVLGAAKSRTGRSTHMRTCKLNRQVRPGKPVGRRGTIAGRREPALTPPPVFHLQPPRTAHRLQEHRRWARVPQGDCPPPGPASHLQPLRQHRLCP